MDWFKRYGIPGVYCWGIGMLWFLAFHPINECVKNSEYLKIVISITIVFFLPVGYFMSLLGQIIYHKCYRMGVDREAREIAGVLDECNSKKEWDHEIATFSQTIEQINGKPKIPVEVVKFVFEFLSKRMDMIVINLSLMLASGISILIASCLSLFWRFNVMWYRVALCVSLLVLIVSWFSWFSLKKQLSHIEAKVFATLGIFKSSPETQRAEDQQLDNSEQQGG